MPCRDYEGSLGGTYPSLPALRAQARSAGSDFQTQQDGRKPSAESILQTPWINELIHQVLVDHVRASVDI